MRLSVILQRPSPRDYQKKLALPEYRMDHYLLHDKNHVAEKLRQMACTLQLPDGSADATGIGGKYEAPEWLIERLGKANTQRRSLFRYIESHHEKIAKYVDAPAFQDDIVSQQNPTREEGDGHEQLTALFYRVPSFGMTMTTVTTVRETPIQLDNLEMEVMSESGQTETSLGTNTTFDDGSGGKVALEVPSPPKSAEPLGDRPFKVRSVRHSGR